MKKIPNFSLYVADDLGNIFSTNYKRTGKTIKLKPSISPDGYYKTMLLRDDGKYLTISVHRLVALTYLGLPNGLEVNHKNGNKLDNSVINLEYVTRSENIRHAFKNKLNMPRRGELNGQSKLTCEQVLEIRAHAENSKRRYYGRKELALKYNVSECCIKEIVNRIRNTWQDV